ncbi:hypothetical protein ACLB2K_015956 [Fragaria x ananassa]
MNAFDEEAKKRKRTVDEEDDGVLLSKLILGHEIKKRKQENKSKIEEPKKKKAEKKTTEIDEEEEDETEKKKIKSGSGDVYEILGLPRKGGSFDTKQVEENVVETLFGTSKRVTKKCVMDALRKLKNQQPTNEEERRKKKEERRKKRKNLQLFAGIKFDSELTDCESEEEEEESEEETVQKKLMEEEETWKAAEQGERPPSSLISDQSQEGNQKAKEVEMRLLTEENERLRCQTESLKEEMRNMEEEYESRMKNEKLNEDLKKLQALVAALAQNSQDERALESNEDDQDPKGGANKGGKINEDLKDRKLIRDFLWEDPLYGSEITKLDLGEVIMDKAVACNVIDCFGALIAEEIS